MPSDWNDDDRRAIKHLAVWGGLLLFGAIVRGVIKEYGDSEPALALTLSAVWIIAAITAVIWDLRRWQAARGRGVIGPTISMLSLERAAIGPPSLDRIAFRFTLLAAVVSTLVFAILVVGARHDQEMQTDRLGEYYGPTEVSQAINNYRRLGMADLHTGDPMDPPYPNIFGALEAFKAAQNRESRYTMAALIAPFACLLCFFAVRWALTGSVKPTPITTQPPTIGS